MACQASSTATVTGGLNEDSSNLPADLRVGAGFTEAVVATGIDTPSAVVPAGDGRVFIASRGGDLFVLSGGALGKLGHVSVSHRGARGVLGMAYAAGNLYVLYTATSPFAHPRLSRFALSSSTLGAETTLVDFPRTYDVDEVGGGLVLGPDGNLYLGLGDDGLGANAQDLSSVFGKVLRLALDGSAPGSNPFAHKAGANAAIYALGFHDPSPAFLADGSLVVADRGESVQEINLVIAGRNYGWPRFEGSASWYYASRFSDPVYSYDATDSECALRGVTYPGGQFPAQYAGAYFFSDACTGRIKVIDFVGGTVKAFARDLHGASALAVDADGSLLAASADEGAVHRVSASTKGPTAPVILSQPASQTVTAGDPATFTVSAQGTAPLAYQWARGGAPITGATGSTYTFTATAGDDGASFSVTVSNGSGAVTSAAASLTVKPAATAPSITTQPASQTVTAGQTATFTVSATGTGPLSFQWARGGAVIGGATSSSYALTAASSDDGASFTVTVSNAAGSVTSTAATLSVTAAVTAPAITSQPQDATVTAGSKVSFSVTASGTGPLAYQWRKGGAAIAGATAASYAFSAAQGDDGASFDVVVSNAAGSATSRAAHLSVNADAQAPSITAQPQSTSVTDGAQATFSVTATGSAPLAYSWRKNGVAVAGATNASWTFTATAADNGAKVDVVVSNAAGSVTSDPAGLTVTPAVKAPSITADPQSVTVPEGQQASFTVAASGTAPLSYQWSRGGKAIAGATAASYAFTAALTDNAASFTVTVSNAAGSATSKAATLTVTQVVVAPTITTQPKAVSVTAGQVASFSVAASGTSPLGYQWRKNGAAVKGATAASFSFTTASGDDGATIDVVVSNAAGSVTSNAVSLTVNTPVQPPVITGQPADATVTVGASATFSVTATGSGLTYQWRRGGTALSGATGSSYTTAATVAGDSGATFDVVVSNAGGSVTSSAAQLTVNAASTVSYSKDIQPIWQKYCNGCHIGGGGAGGLKLDATVSYANLVNKTSNCNSSLKEIAPNSTTGSLMWLVMADDPSECGQPMPEQKGGLKGMDAAAFKLVETWIDEGAHNN